jgi:hypothetical protein
VLAANSSGDCVVLAQSARGACVVLAWCLRKALCVRGCPARAWLPRVSLPRGMGSPFFALAWLGLACLALAKNGMSATTLRTAG